MTMKSINFDHISANPLLPEVKKAMIEAIHKDYHNPSSQHRAGEQAAEALEQARASVAKLINAAMPKEIVFTSGGTESINHAIKGVALANADKGKHIITSNIEHNAVIRSLRRLKSASPHIDLLPPLGSVGVTAMEIARRITSGPVLLAGLDLPTAGEVWLAGQRLNDLDEDGRARVRGQSTGFVFQSFHLIASLTALENVMLPLELAGAPNPAEAALEAIRTVGLEPRKGHYPHQLSGGEKQRVGIARALASDPRYMLLDEPFAGVDPIAVEDIQDIVSKLRSKNIGILITDHNVHETLAITERAYLMFEGSILKAGTAEDLAEDEQVRKVYLGQNFELR